MPEALAAAAPWHVRHRFLLGFALLSLLMGTSIGLAKVTTSLYALALGARGGWLGAIAAAQSGGILLTALPIGLWAERLGPARLFVAGSLAGGALYLALPAVPDPAYLLVLTALTGVIMPARFVSLQMVFMAMLQQIGSAHAGWQRAAHMSGMFLIGPLATAGVIAHLGHAGSFWLVAALFVLTALLSPPVLRQAPTAAPRAASGRTTWREVLRELLRSPQARSLAAMEASIQALNMFHTFFIVVIAVQSLQASPVAAGALVSLQGGSFIAALLCLGGWVARHERRGTLAGIGLVLLALLCLSQSPHAAGLAVGSVLQGVGLGLLEIRVLTQLARLGQQIGLGRVAGLNALVGPGGALLGGLLGGAIGGWLGLQLSFTLFMPLFVALGWASWRRQRRDQAAFSS